jgi:Holliday junction resolvase
MNNKKLGTAFERRVCEILKESGYWVHFLAPDSRGSQPFDIIAVKGGFVEAIECKTLDKSQRWFRIDRLEENQKTAFDYWEVCGNDEPIILIEHGERIAQVGWHELKERGKVEINESRYIK